jgi:hypothetical protein
VSGELSGVNLARQALVTAREAALRTYSSDGARILALHDELQATGMPWPAG